MRFLKPKPTSLDELPDTDPAQAADLAYDAARQRVQWELGTSDTLDVKATTVVTIAIGLVAVMAAVVALRPDRFNGAVTTWFYLALALLVLDGLLFACATATRKWRTGLRPEDIMKDYERGVSEHAVKWSAVHHLIGSSKVNAELLSTKRKWLGASYAGLGVELLSVIVVLVKVARR